MSGNKDTLGESFLLDDDGGDGGGVGWLKQQQPLIGGGAAAGRSSVSSLRSSFTGFLEEDRRQSEWYHTTLLLIADIIGTGVLSLPGAFAKLGWGGGLLMFVICYPLNLYTGVLLSRLSLEYPRQITYGTLGMELLGSTGAFFGWTILYGYLYLLLGDYLIVLGKSVQAIFYTHHLCRPNAGLAACLVLAVTNQIRTLHGIALVSVVSFVTIVAAVIICMARVWSEGVEAVADDDGSGGLAVDDDDDINTPWLNEKATFWDFFATLSSFAFAFSGQKIYLEMMSEMKDAREFPKAMYTGTATITLVYGFVCISCYALLGTTHTPSYLMDVLGFDTYRIIANMCMFCHIVISYTVSQQVFNRALHVRYDARLANVLDRSAGADYWRARLQWFVITTITMFMAWLMSNAIPFFDDFISLSGSICSAPLSFLFPAGLYLAYLHKKQRRTVRTPILERALCYFLLVMSAFMILFGTISSTKNIISDEGTYGLPFDCFCASEQCLSGG